MGRRNLAVSQRGQPRGLRRRSRFGGYDPIAVGRGAGTAGHPELWLVFEQRLYFFYDAQARDEFTARAEEVIEEANARWDEVLRKLVP